MELHLEVVSWPLAEAPLGGGWDAPRAGRLGVSASPLLQGHHSLFKVICTLVAHCLEELISVSCDDCLGVQAAQGAEPGGGLAWAGDWKVHVLRRDGKKF